jgi:uncharacterized protein YqfA (UPF0365 family)
MADRVMGGGWIVLLAGVTVVVVSIAAVSLYIYYGRLYMRARVAGAEVSLRRLVRMTASGVSAFKVVTAFLDVRRAGIAVSLDELETHARAGGDPKRVARRLIEARASGDEIRFDAAAADDLRNGRHAART